MKNKKIFKRIIENLLVFFLILQLPFLTEGIINQKIFAFNKAEAGVNINTPPAIISGIRVGYDVTKTRMVIDFGTDSIPEYAISEEEGGKRIKLFLFNTTNGAGSIPPLKKDTFKDISISADGPATVITIDLKEKLSYKCFPVGNPARLVLDVNKDYEKISTMLKGDGLKYTKYIRGNGNGMITAYILEIDINKYKLSQALALGNISNGRATVSEIVSANQAVAGINAGYFSFGGGDLLGVNRMGGQTVSTTYYNRTGFGIMKDRSFKIAPVEYSGVAKVGELSLPVSGVNCTREQDSLILYNNIYGNTTQTNEYGTEYTVINNKISKITKGNSTIPHNGWVISAHGSMENTMLKAAVKVNDPVEISEAYIGELSDAVDIIGGGPTLLKNGEIYVTAKEEKFPNDIAVGRAPRTALGIMKNGNIMFLVVDGRQSHSIGTTLTETAQLMKQFGAVEAMNLDGGGSSEMVINGEVMNSVSDGAERRVGSAVIIKAK